MSEIKCWIQKNLITWSHMTPLQNMLENGWQPLTYTLFQLLYYWEPFKKYVSKTGDTIGLYFSQLPYHYND